MKDYCDRNYKVIKSKAYLVWGLVMSALSMIMLLMSLIAAIHKYDILIIVTGFGAAAVWTVAAVACISIYYNDNRIVINEKAKEIAEAVENAVKK